MEVPVVKSAPRPVGVGERVVKPAWQSGNCLGVAKPGPVGGGKRVGKSAPAVKTAWQLESVKQSMGCLASRILDKAP